MLSRRECVTLLTGAGGPRAALFGQLAKAVFSPGRKDENRVLVHRVQSPSQRGETTLRVLLPDSRAPGERFRVLYVLPVEALDGRRWGDGLDAIHRQEMHNRYRLICVAPAFSDLPWYADHPTDERLRQESHFVNEVVPFIDGAYPTAGGREARLLLGFSKSGWGAWSLLLRHPDTFGRAAAWDAPLNQDRPDRFGMGPIFGTPENFERYRVSALLERQAAELRGEARLVLTGYGNFRAHHEAIHEQLLRLGIPHVYVDGPPRWHHWETGWIEEAIRLLLGGGAAGSRGR